MIFVVKEIPDCVEFVIKSPVGISNADAADRIWDAIDTVKAADPENWNYGQAIALLEIHGWEKLEFQTLDV